ncbi:hypothetical protein BGZ96_010793 [Linnemannia gamsii]|uniref:Beta-lactamase-related domain-containing protein n=1 Tax=Linnemannia gamsii TaxID=64522 RepID=A0ABQ7JTY2_9FUNG|nr:hypothetical protein BGZ96_010793 [Linnemannia gamsii]
MLSHRTKLSPAVGYAWFRSRTPRRELITHLRHADMPRKLDGKRNYSNVMYAVAGEAAANVAGTSYEQLVHDKVLAPLGLAANTGFSQSAMKKLPNHASPYYADSFAQAQKGEFREAKYDEIYMAFSPAGDLHSNVLDLVKWGKVVVDGGMLDGKQVLNKENVKMTVTSQSIVPQGTRMSEFSDSFTYGLGWGLMTYKGHNCYLHSGEYPGSSANLMLFPDDDLIIAQLANIEPTDLLHYARFFIADKVLDLPTQQDWLFDNAVKDTAAVYEEYAADREGKNLPKRIEGRPSVLPREELVGEFKSPLYGVITIVSVSTPVALGADEGKEKKGEEEEEEEGLEIHYHEFRNKLEYYHFETFKTVLDDGFVPGYARLVSFETGADGRISGLSIDFESPDMVRFVKVKTSVVATAVTEKEE